VLDVVHAGDGVVAADQERRVVARITVPGRRVCRGRLTEGEPGELDEHIFNRDVTATGGVEEPAAVVAEVRGQGVRVGRVALSEHVELEVALSEGADHAVFSCGARIDSQRKTRTFTEAVAETIAQAQIAAPR